MNAGNHPLRTLPNELRDILRFLKGFAKNPVLAMRLKPDWSWPALIILQGVFAFISGLVSGLLLRSMTQVLAGVILLPITSTLVLFIVSGFFYYCFLFLFQRQVDFKLCFTILLLANLPMMLLHMISSYIPPISLLGVAIAGVLMTVGFSENFKIPKKPLIRLIAGLYFFFVLLSVLSSLKTDRKHKAIEEIATPESVEILKREAQEQ